MRFAQVSMIRACVAVAAGAVAAWLMLPGAPARAADAITMKISVPTIHDIPNEWIDNFAAMVEKGSGGRIKPEIYPASQLGSIPRQIEGTQFGSIQVQLIPPEFMVGLDQRFQVLAAPGLVNTDAQGQKLALDQSVRQLMLGLGANRGLHGVGLFFAEANEMISRTPIKTLDDLKGKKIRIFASPFHTVAFQRLGMTPVAMTLGDVVPGLQEGTIDCAMTGIGPIVNFHMFDAAKYVVEFHQPAIFIVAEVSKKWFDGLPKDLQELIEKSAEKADHDIIAVSTKMVDETTEAWKKQGGTLIPLPEAERTKLMKILGDVGTEVASKDPGLAAAYKTVTDAAHTLSASAK